MYLVSTIYTLQPDSILSGFDRVNRSEEPVTLCVFSLSKLLLSTFFMVCRKFMISIFQPKPIWSCLWLLFHVATLSILAIDKRGMQTTMGFVIETFHVNGHSDLYGSLFFVEHFKTIFKRRDINIISFFHLSDQREKKHSELEWEKRLLFIFCSFIAVKREYIRRIQNNF